MKRVYSYDAALCTISLPRGLTSILINLKIIKTSKRYKSLIKIVETSKRYKSLIKIVKKI